MGPAGDVTDGARKRFTVDDHRVASAGWNAARMRVIDETPMAYKDIEAGLDAQRDLVEIVDKLSQVVCVKG